MNFNLNDQQLDIQRAARDLLNERIPWDRLTALGDSRGYDQALLGEMVDLGWPGVALPESSGGADLGMLELSLLLQELGYSLAPVPFLGTVAVSTILATCGSEAQRARWLPGLVSGESRGGIGFVDEVGAPCRLALDGSGADVVVIATPSRAWIAAAEDVDVTTVETVDRTREFGSVEGYEEWDAVEGNVPEAIARVSIAVAAESLGVAQRTLEIATDYAKDREQFGVPIGSFQSVANRCARMLLECESTRSAVQYAAWIADWDEGATIPAAAAAYACAARSGWWVPHAAIQVLGGVGFTWEHPAHLFLRRGAVNAQLVGGRAQHLETVASSLLGEAVPVGGIG